MARNRSSYEQRKLLNQAKALARRAGVTEFSIGRQVAMLADATGYSAGRNVARYATGTAWTPRGAAGRFIREFLGSLFGSKNIGQKDLLSAISLLRDAGFNVGPGGTVVPPPVQRMPVMPPPRRGVTPPPVQRPDTREDRREPPPRKHDNLPDRRKPAEVPSVGTGGDRRRAWNEPPAPGEESPFGEEILSPQSSNVFSFSFVPHGGQRKSQVGTLFVTFKANKLNSGSVSVGKGRKGGMSQLRGRRGSTVGGKTNERGAQYAYNNVPTRLFTQMKQAASKGKFVWDNLRIRGTVYGHKFSYQLVAGSVTIQDGVSGVYIPRRATKRGFAVRSVAVVGTGRRGFQSSTLAGQRGHGTRR